MTLPNPTTPHTRTVVANFSLSLDGRIAGPGGDYDMGWIVPHAVTDSARDHLTALTQPATTVLLGRKNYQGFGGYWPGVADDANADPRDRAFSRWLSAVEKIVFSHSLEAADWSNSRLARGEPAAVVAELQSQPGGDILVMASFSVIKALLAADAIDRLSITLCPEVAGGGARLFEDGQPGTSWSLSHSAASESGALSLHYDRKR